MSPLLLLPHYYCSRGGEPLASKLARWRASLSTLSTAADQQQCCLGVGVEDAAAAAAGKSPAVLAPALQPHQLQPSPQALLGRSQLRSSLLPVSFAAATAAARRRPLPSLFRAASFSTSSSARPSAPADPGPHRSPALTGAGLGGGGAGSGGGGGGGTLASVIAAEAGKTRVSAYLHDGFVINQVQVKGSVLCLPETWLMWDVGPLPGSGEEKEEGEEKDCAVGEDGGAHLDPLDALVPPSALALLELVHPPPEVLVLGCGARAPARPPPRLRAWLHRGRPGQPPIALELLRTPDAVALFALLNDEGRPAVGAFLPPGVVLPE